MKDFRTTKMRLVKRDAGPAVDPHRRSFVEPNHIHHSFVQPLGTFRPLFDTSLISVDANGLVYQVNPEQDHFTKMDSGGGGGGEKGRRTPPVKGMFVVPFS